MNPPIKNYKHALYPEGSVTQWFGENPQLYRLWGLQGHNGIDIVAPHGEPIMAVEEGIVVEVNYNPEGYGKHIRIQSLKSYNGAYREWGYAHLSKVHTTVGSKVEAGEVIGLMGNTGFVVSGATPYWKYNPYAGTHLHLGLRYAEPHAGGWKYHKSNPFPFQIENYDNGYKGSVDSAPLFAPVSDKKKQQMLTIISLSNTVISLLKQLIAQKNGVPKS